MTFFNMMTWCVYHKCLVIWNRFIRLQFDDLSTRGQPQLRVFLAFGALRCFLTLLPPLVALQGEICLCTSRIYVERSIFKEFVERLVVAARKWKTGDPSDANNNNGALISKEHLEKVTLIAKYLSYYNMWLLYVTGNLNNNNKKP